MAQGQKWRSFRVDGVWWKPDDPRRLPGTLIVSRSGGLSLSLIVDDLEAPRPINGPIGVDASERSGMVMLGLTNDGRRYTLWDGFFAGGNPWSAVFRSVGQKQFHFNRGIEGTCDTEPKELRFSSANVRIGILAAWLGRTAFDIHGDAFAEEGWRTLKWIRPQSLAYTLREGLETSFAWSTSGPNMRWFQTSAAVAVRPRLRMEYTEPASMAICESDLMVVTNLIQLLSGRAIMYREECFISPSAQTLLSDGTPIPKELRLLGSRLKLTSGQKSIGPQSLLFPFSSIEQRFGQLLQSWWQLYRANEHALGSYFSVGRWAGSFADDRFFVTASAAEAVHAALNPHQKSLGSGEWKQIRRALQAALPEEHRAKLLPKLSHLPRLAFSERIEGLVSALPNGLRQRVIGDPERVAHFAKRVKDLRNAKAHQLRHRTTGVELVRLANKLRVLIDCALLQRIGLSGDEVAAAIERCYEYQFYAFDESWPWEVCGGDE